ncbi:unnamed protein product [Rhizophagus irregularis]|nr:unnamed protein product [Rhizophagus irregularis]CAB4438324.1 unnamed protein product [Rhizophagus irregularis]
MIGVHLETLPTVRLSVKGEMGMEDTINDDGPYCVKEAENEFRTSISKVKEAETSSGLHIEGKGNRNESYDFEVFPAYLDVNTMDALVSLAGNANKNYNPDRTAYLGIPLWGSLAQAACTIAHIEVKEAERQVGLPYRRFSYRRYKKPKGSVMFTNVSAFSFVCPRLSGRFVGSISRVQDAEGTGLNFEGPGRRRT